MLPNSVERINPAHFRSKEKYLLYLRHLFAYEIVAAQLSGSERLLEIGFGEGYGARYLAGFAQEVVAVDVDHGSVAHARQVNGSANCRFMQYDGDRLPFDDASFDVVSTMQVIEHVENDRAFVMEARRVLKPGGIMWLTTPNRTHRIAPGAPVWNPFHVREYYPSELESLLGTVFGEVKVGGIYGTPEVQQIEFRRVRQSLTLRKLIPEFVKGWLDRSAITSYSTADFRVDLSSPADGSLDLVGCCVKTMG